MKWNGNEMDHHEIDHHEIDVYMGWVPKTTNWTNNPEIETLPESFLFVYTRKPPWKTAEGGIQLFCQNKWQKWELV